MYGTFQNMGASWIDFKYRAGGGNWKLQKVTEVIKVRGEVPPCRLGCFALPAVFYQPFSSLQTCLQTHAGEDVIIRVKVG